MDWSSDGSRLLSTSGNDDSGTSDNAGHIWDGVTGKELLSLAGHTKAVTSGDWSPNDKRVATISSDGTVRVWDATTGDELLRLTIPVLYLGM